jgi:hypothetical protein
LSREQQVREQAGSAPGKALRRRLARPRLWNRLALALLAIGSACLHAQAGSAGSDPSARQSASQQSSVTAPATLSEDIVSASDCAGLEAELSRYRQRVLTPMRQWAERALPDPGDEPVVYPFSGADVATALALFGRSERLVMLSRQEVSLAQLEPADPETERAECETQRFFARTGFYRTLDLEGKVEGRQGPAPRLLSLLLLSLETVGIRVTGIVPLRTETDGSIVADPVLGVTVDLDGRIRPNSQVHAALPGSVTRTITLDAPPAGPKGLRLRGIDELGQPRIIDYLSLDLSNGGIRPQSIAFRTVARLIEGTVLIKSGSHLLQSAHFTSLARLITEQAGLVVQDETGLDVTALASFERLSLHGTFTEPHEFWREQASMQRLRTFVESRETAETPPFAFGYRKPSGTFILVAARGSPR